MGRKHFLQGSHNFNKLPKFTIIDQLLNTSKSKETLTQRATHRKRKFLHFKVR